MKINYFSTAGNFCVSELAQLNRHELEQPPGWFLSLPKGSIRAHLTHSLHLLSTALYRLLLHLVLPQGVSKVFSASSGRNHHLSHMPIPIL